MDAQVYRVISTVSVYERNANERRNATKDESPLWRLFDADDTSFGLLVTTYDLRNRLSVIFGYESGDTYAYV